MTTFNLKRLFDSSIQSYNQYCQEENYDIAKQIVIDALILALYAEDTLELRPIRNELLQVLVNGKNSHMTKNYLDLLFKHYGHIVELVKYELNLMIKDDRDCIKVLKLLNIIHSRKYLIDIINKIEMNFDILERDIAPLNKISGTEELIDYLKARAIV